MTNELEKKNIEERKTKEKIEIEKNYKNEDQIQKKRIRE